METIVLPPVGETLKSGGRELLALKPLPDRGQRALSEERGHPWTSVILSKAGFTVVPFGL